MIRSERYRKGLRGEKKVLKILKKLGRKYYIYNDIPKFYGNIDHLVLGPNGIFVIETKNYSTNLFCISDNWFIITKKGKRKIKSPAKQVKENVKTIKLFLEKNNIYNIPIEGIVVLADPKVNIRIENPTIKVLKLDELYRYIKNKKSTKKLSKKELKKLNKLITSFEQKLR